MSSHAQHQSTEQVRAKALRQSDRHIARLMNEPERDIRERRSAFDTMLSMVTRIEQEATTTNKRKCIVGEDFYVAHDGCHFEVWIKNRPKVLVKRTLQVLTLFDARAFVSGHVTIVP